MNHINAMNLGVFTSGTEKPTRGGKPAKKTLIVTGVARSGTSLIASMLKEAGIYMGEFLHEVVEEDAQILEMLRSGQKNNLKALIADRNAHHDRWGFKVPNLHAYLDHRDLKKFRNPHLIVIYRDPVAVAQRNVLSEHLEQFDALIAASNAMHAMARFAKMADCPALLLSYEKALAFPNVLIDSLIAFCDLRLDQNARNLLYLRVQPNRAEYLAAARRHFRGKIDGLVDGQLFGWCNQDGRMEPVRVDILANGRLIESVRADLFRDDLAAIGVGNGCHGFAVDIAHYGLTGGTEIRARVSGRTIELENSGMTLGAMPVRITA